MSENKSSSSTVHVYGSVESISSYLQTQYKLRDESVAVSITQLLALLDNEENGEFDFEGLPADEYSQQLTTGLLGALPVYINTTDIVINLIKEFPGFLIYNFIKQLMTGDLSMRTFQRDLLVDFLDTLRKAGKGSITKLTSTELCVCYRAWELTKGRRPFSLEEIALDVEKVGCSASQERRFICPLSGDDNIQQTPQATFRCPSHEDGNYCKNTPDNFKTIIEHFRSLGILDLDETGDEDRYVFRR